MDKGPSVNNNFNYSESYEKICDFQNLRESSRQCELGVRWKHSTQSYEVNNLINIAQLQQDLTNGTYKSRGFKEFTINERGKTRRIQSVHITERCVQKSLCNYVMKPILIPTLVYDNGASQKGKGTDFALNRLKCHLERHYRKYGRQGGILTIDFKDYFNSINHKVLLDMLSKYFPDEDVYILLHDFVNNFDRGLGLGSEVSQICAITFPNKMDHYIKEELRIKGSGRYMDDSYIIHHNIEFLKLCLEKIKEICAELKLTLNPKHTKITPLTQQFEYLKKRIILQENGRVSMRLVHKNIVDKKRIMRKQKEKLCNGTMTLQQIEQSFVSWRGYAEKYDSHRTIRSMEQYYKTLFGVSPPLSTKELKRIKNKQKRQ